jgi:DnaJ-domain-containing protein 1
MSKKPKRTEDEPGRDEHFGSPRFQDMAFEEKDYRDYWNWDPDDWRVAIEHDAIEAKEWRRLQSGPKQKPPPKKPPPPIPVDKLTEWHRLLNVRPGFSKKDLKNAFKKAAFKYHPDRRKRADAKLRAEEMFKRVSDAFRELQKLAEK